MSDTKQPVSEKRAKNYESWPSAAIKITSLHVIVCLPTPLNIKTRIKTLAVRARRTTRNKKNSWHKSKSEKKRRETPANWNVCESKANTKTLSFPTATCKFVFNPKYVFFSVCCCLLQKSRWNMFNEILCFLGACETTTSASNVTGGRNRAITISLTSVLNMPTANGW